jgi:hypothetical protein
MMRPLGACWTLFKIPLHPPLLKGDNNEFFPLAKSVRLETEGSQGGFVGDFDSIGV